MSEAPDTSAKVVLQLTRPPKGPIHVVARGDTLWAISRRHGADLAAVRRTNAELDPRRLVVGQRILVPGGGSMAPPSGKTAAPPKPRSSRPDGPVRTRVPRRARASDHLWPLRIHGLLTRRFSSAHPGIDIAAPKGTPVRAIARGTVVWAGWKNNGGGYVVEVKHPDGMRSIYNHNSRVAVQRGDKVARGETIALVGSTGWSTGPHLDLRIEMGGRFVDPLDLY